MSKTIEERLNALLEAKEDNSSLEEAKLQVIEEAKDSKESKKDDDKKSDKKADEKKDENSDVNNPLDSKEEPVAKVDNPINPQVVSDNDDVQSGKETDEDDDKKEEVKEETSITIDSILDEEFSDEFKLKAKTIFEAALKEQKELLEEEYKKKEEELITLYASKEAALTEDFDIKVATKVCDFEEKMREDIDGYLGALSEEWVKKNELAIDAGVKAELSESLIDGLKTLLEEHYIEVPEAKVDYVEKLEEEKDSLNDALATSISEYRSLTEKYNAILREQIITEATKDFKSLDGARFQGLMEDFDFESEESFRKRTEIVKQAFFDSKTPQLKDTPTLNEDFARVKVVEVPAQKIFEEKILDVDTQSPMNTYLKYLGKK